MSPLNRISLTAAPVRASCIALAVAGAVAAVTARAPQSTGWRQDDAAGSTERIVTAAMKSFDVPGMSVAVVKGGTTVLAKGFGVRRVGASAAVDETTLFGLASNTKLLTATAIGLLVDDGKLTWDRRVVDVLPWFQLSNPEITRELAIRDLLTHCVLGPNVGDLLITPTSTYTRREVVEHLRYLQIANPFRGTYTYAGTMYLVAGEIIEAVSGQPYEEFVANRLLKPMGMATSSVRLSDLGRTGNIAVPHAFVDGALRVIDGDLGSNANPARGFNTNAVEMTRWLTTFLKRGLAGTGTRVYSEATQKALETIVTPEPLGNPNPNGPFAKTSVTYRGYALGLHVQDYRGKKLVMHGGVLPGFVSRVAWIPEMDLGVAVLTNADIVGAPYAVLYSIIDGFLGVSDTDWIAAYARSATRRPFRPLETPALLPPAQASKYAGRYFDSWYGDAVVALEDGRLVIRFPKSPQLVGDLLAPDDNTFLLRWRVREIGPDAAANFTLDSSGAVSELRLVANLYNGLADFTGLVLKPKR